MGLEVTCNFVRVAEVGIPAGSEVFRVLRNGGRRRTGG